MRINHYAVFKNKMKTLDWENLRNTESEAPYFLPYKKEDYLKKVESKTPSISTEVILKELERIGSKKILSIGSGVAAQEYQLKKFSSYTVVVTDYNSTVLRLKEFGVFDDALILDAFIDPLPADENWVLLFHRIDTEFDDDQLSKLFAKCHAAGVKQICFIPGELLSFKIILVEIKTFLASILKARPRVFCGYIRSLGYFKKIWNPYYEISKMYTTDKKIFFLQAK
jgi:hypothetical protein